MFFCEFLQNILRGRDDLAFAILHWLRQEHLVEEDIAKLLGGVDVEAMPGISSHCSTRLSVDALSEIVDLNCQATRHVTKYSGVDANSHLLHPQKNRHKRLVDRVVNLEQR